MKKLLNLILLILGLDCDARRDAVDGGVCDLSGQGKDANGL